jgi:TM2 domain-containing membrane protein YozV
MLSDRKVACEGKLALLHLNRGLLVTIALSYSGLLILLLWLVLPRICAFIGIMPWLPTVVANVGWKFLWLGDLLLGLTVLKISR